MKSVELLFDRPSYNKPKCAVDIVDQMTRQYTVKAGTTRCPLTNSINLFTFH